MNTIFPSATGRRVLSLIIGIDPGLDGAISFVDERGGLYAVLSYADAARWSEESTQG